MALNSTKIKLEKGELAKMARAMGIKSSQARYRLDRLDISAIKTLVKIRENADKELERRLELIKQIEARTKREIL